MFWSWAVWVHSFVAYLLGLWWGPSEGEFIVFLFLGSMGSAISWGMRDQERRLRALEESAKSTLTQAAA